MKRKYESEYELTSLVKGKKSYRYRGKWYHIDLDAPSYRRFWVCQLLLSLAAVGLLVGSGLVPSYSMYAFYAFLPYVVTYLPVLYMLIHALFCPLKNEPMEHIAYDQQYGRQKIYVIASLVCCLASAVTGAVAIFLDSPHLSPASFVQTILLLLLAGDLLIFWKLLRRIPVSNTDKKPGSTHT